MLSEPQAVLAELFRVLKQDGILSLSADHMKKDKAISRVTSSRLFSLSKEGRKTLSFSKQG
jgi:ubiquinone/menaquinone biosynthesis C-methylase UbiE